MDVLSEYDLIQAMSGVDENGEGKCAIAITHQRCDSRGVVRDVDDEFVSEKPVVQVFKQPGGFLCVDLLFRSIEDKDLKIIYSYLDRFFAATNSASDDETDFPLLSVVIVPREYGGKYWAIGLNPILYALTPEDSAGEPRIIRMTFMAQDDQDALPNFLFLASPEETIDSFLLQEDDGISAIPS